jgi:hypothetical protein
VGKQLLKFISGFLAFVIMLNLFTGSALSILLKVTEKHYTPDFSGDDDEIELIKIFPGYSPADFQRIGEHEIIYQKKLYDIIHSFTKDGVQHFYCVNDFKEEKILQRIQQCTAEHLNYYQDGQQQAETGYKLFVTETFGFGNVKKELPQSDFTFHFAVEKFPEITWLENTSPPPEIHYS